MNHPRRAAEIGGRTAYTIESFLHRGESLLDQGHGLTGDGVRIANPLPLAMFVMR